jgi:hypothetical protein
VQNGLFFWEDAWGGTKKREEKVPKVLMRVSVLRIADHSGRGRYPGYPGYDETFLKEIIEYDIFLFYQTFVSTNILSDKSTKH